MRAKMTMAALGLALAAPAFAAPAVGDAVAGRAYFRGKCPICHSVSRVAGKFRAGPTLFGVVGRKAGSMPGYKYSLVTTNSNLVWDAATLDVYLADPRAIVRGTKMAYAGIGDPHIRANVIAYLATLK